MSISEQENIESDTNTYDSDDSSEDPTFDVLDDTPSRFSRLSITKKSEPCVAKKLVEDLEEDGEYVVEFDLPELDEKAQKSYEIIENLIKAGEVAKLKVDQCKVYLRKHGLRLTGNKDILIGRIKEHLEIIDGGGERKYPASSFVMNCKGDACAGDIVMFEQNVYEMFSVASRSATGPPCGTRTVAGRILKESYGAAKQQHTFTIEVLWSKGEKPFPPLRPLLIKGRNLYRLKTLRQKWEDEGEWHKILLEKHVRGVIARSSRDERVRRREMRKLQKQGRTLRADGQSNTLPRAIDNRQKPQEAGTKEQQKLGYDLKQMSYRHYNPNSSVLPNVMQIRHVVTDARDIDHLRHHHDNLRNAVYTSHNSSVLPNVMQIRHVVTDARDIDHSRHHHDNLCNAVYTSQNDMNGERQNYNAMIRRPSSSNTVIGCRVMRPTTTYLNSLKQIRRPPPPPYHGQKKPCRFFAQGRCYYGDSCKYLHE